MDKHRHETLLKTRTAEGNERYGRLANGVSARRWLAYKGPTVVSMRPTSSVPHEIPLFVALVHLGSDPWILRRDRRFH